MFDNYDYSSGCLWWRSGHSQWERAGQEVTVRAFYSTMTISSASISPIFLFPHFFITVRHNTSQDSRLIVLYICFSIKVTLDHTQICEMPWNHHFQTVMTNNRCVVSCSGWCVRFEDKPLFKSCFKLSLCLWSHVLSRLLINQPTD